MSIEVACEKCSKKIRVPDKYAGKRVKCPGCGGPIEVDAAAKTQAGGGAIDQRKETRPRRIPRRQSAPPRPGEAPEDPPETPKWHMQTEAGEEYGPITRTELDEWFADGRIDATCQILCDDWDHWKWAEEVFPGLTEEIQDGTDENPFAGIGDAVARVDPNPFASPQAPTAPPVQPQQPAEEGDVSTRMFQAMRDTRPWVTLLAILGFCVAGLMALGTLVMIAMAGVGGVILGIPNLVICGLYVYCAYLLLDYGRKIQIFLRRKETQQLETALLAQRTFWKVVGIMTLIAIGLGVVMIVLGIVVGAMIAAALSQTQ